MRGGRRPSNGGCGDGWHSGRGDLRAAMRRPLVYLAGGIAGLDTARAGTWRCVAQDTLAVRGIEALDPMRGKRHAFGTGKISHDFHDYEENGPFFTSRGIITRDYNDVRRSDALLVNLYGAIAPSMGTIMELGWTYAWQKPVVAYIETKPCANPHLGHPMVYETMPFRFDDLFDAIDAVAVLLGR